MKKINLFKTRLLIMLIVFLSNLLMNITSAEETSFPVLNTKTKIVAVFKNGLGFFIRDGVVAPKDGWTATEFVPNSTLGSIWIGSLDKDTNLEEIIGFKEEIKKETDAISIEDLIKVNIGKNVIITFNEETIEGKIKSVPDDRKIDKKNIAGYEYHSSYVSTPSQCDLSSIVIIETKNGDVALNRKNISKIEFLEDYSNKILIDEVAKRVKIKVASSPGKKTKLSLSYLQKGITWLPSYLINIENPKKARITMKATVINDVEDLENADIFFVVGYPNFLFADILSPMSLDQSITQFIKALEEGGRRPEEYGRMSNIMRQSTTTEGEMGGIPGLDFSYSAIKSLPGESEEDLFLYNKKNVSFKKGERAYYHIFSEEVDYKHIYEWEVPDTINVNPQGYQRSEQKKEEREQVWHSIKLTNSTAYPWTTAPAFAISSWKPIAQDIIDYTPKGSNTNLKLTIATDVKTNRHEYEIDRQRDVELYRQSYDLVTIKGELYIKNCKDKDINMEIKKRLTGEVIEATHDGKINKLAEGLKGVNYNSNISWEIPIKAGKEINLIYKYKVYIYH